MKELYNLKYELPKLVRDKVIPENVENKIEINIETNNETLLNLLYKKLLEESWEVFKNRSPEEIWDLLDVIDEICTRSWFSKDEINKLRKNKNEKWWWFNKWVILLKTNIWD